MKKFFCLLAASCLCTTALYAKEYHVAPGGSNANDGSISAPLKTINEAAQRALPGDTVTVHEGTYREWVNPLNGGESDSKRILYRVADGETWSVSKTDFQIEPAGQISEYGGTWKILAMVKSNLYGDMKIVAFAKVARNTNSYPQTLGYYVADFNAYKVN